MKTTNKKEMAMKMESPRQRQIREMNEKSKASGAKIKGKGSWYSSGPNERVSVGLKGNEAKEMIAMKASRVKNK